MLLVSKAEYVKDFLIKLSFNNNKSGVLNFKKIIFNDSRVIFNPLKNKEYFKNFSIKYDTLVWDNELDFAPEYLFYSLFQNVPEYFEIFKKWGYINTDSNATNKAFTKPI
ncbi:MAG: DUF2442 domain-containing protein [Candidatus Cloacimonadota bacterium]|nr:DUF2442 domain-containing protein [Candidatus Cloacimonadota bacterium]